MSNAQNLLDFYGILKEIEHIPNPEIIMSNAYHGAYRSTFEQCYRCYPASVIDKPHMERGDKVIMPASALDRLAFLQIDYPMMFELTNTSSGRVSHCGVLEFIADEGLIYLPNWMMENMQLQEGDVVQMKSASLSKGTYVKLQPHTKNFLDISNPKAILESSLRNYSCLTTGDTVMVDYNNTKYYINIVETKPSSAVSIIETDCEVDFAPPLDYKEPEKKPQPSTLSKKTPPEVSEEEPAMKIAKICPFSGSSRRLDGKPSTQSGAAFSSPVLKQHQPEPANVTASSLTPTSTSRHRSGKLMFGGNATHTSSDNSTAAPKVSKKQETPQTAEEPKFQAFSGKKYSLKG